MIDPENSVGSGSVDQLTEVMPLCEHIRTIQSGTATPIEIELGFRALYDGLNSDIRKFTNGTFSGVTPEDLDDVTQETFLDVWRALRRATYREERTNVKAWALSIAHNNAVDAFRRASIRPTVSLDGLQYEGEDLGIYGRVVEGVSVQPEQVDETAERAIEHVHDEERIASFNRVNAEQRTALILNNMGYTQEEIANMLGLPVGTVKGRMRLGYEKIEAIKRESEPLDGETLQRAA